MSVAVASKNTLAIPAGDKVRKKSIRLSNALALELLNYGVVPSNKLIQRISTHPVEQTREICNKILKMYTIGDVNPPLFDNWESRTEFTSDEFVIQIFGYVLQISGNDLCDPAYMARLRAKIDFSDLLTLKLAKDDVALNRFNVLVNSKATLDRKSQADLFELAKTYYEHAPLTIRSAEARVAIIWAAIENGLPLAMALGYYAQNEADVLRVAVLEIEYVKLPADVLYKSLSWKNRKALLGFLVDSFSFEDLCEAMGNNRQAWYRFFCHFHIFQQADFRTKFTSVVAAAFVSVGSKLNGVPSGPVRKFIMNQHNLVDITDSGNMVYRTFASRVQSAVDAQDMELFKSVVKTKAGYLFRNLGSLSNVTNRKNQSEFVDFVRGLIHSPSSSVLLSLIQINVSSSFRIIDSKGNTTVQPANYNPMIAEIQGLAERELYRRHGFPGRVEVSPKIHHKVVPFLATNAELDRGTKIPFSDKAYLYFFMHWIQTETVRTDLDHSYVCVDSDWNTETVYFGRQANNYISQSGDITNAPAPHGGTEYGRINLRNIPNSVRYIVPIINVFCGDVFNACPTAYAGFMFSHEPKFSIQQDHVRYDLTQPANSNIPFIIDVAKRELIIVDFNKRKRDGLTAHSSITEIKQVISALKTKKFMTIQRFANLLSGDADEVSLKITPRGKGDDKIAPENLLELVF